MRWLTRKLFSWLMEYVAVGTPHFTIGPDDRPYLRRWWVIPRNKLFNIYLHQFLSSDDDRALHDHPWFNCSILLRGQYVEHTIKAGGIHRKRKRQRGDIVIRSPWTAHRIELMREAPCWTLFITGPVMRVWGFHCRWGWRPWHKFVDLENPGLRGRGCE